MRVFSALLLGLLLVSDIHAWSTNGILTSFTPASQMSKPPSFLGKIEPRPSIDKADQQYSECLQRTSRSNKGSSKVDSSSSQHIIPFNIFASTILCFAILTTPITVSLDWSTNSSIDQETTRIPVSLRVESLQAQAAMTENQQFVSDVWWAVTAQFFDPTFNGLGKDGWRSKKTEAIQAVADTGPEDETIVAEAIQKMLSHLGDPYTRYLPKDKFETLTVYATGGNAAGIGVQLLENPRTNTVSVMATSPGGPAEKTGIRAGDTILEVDGEVLKDTTADIVAAKCRGGAGSQVTVLIQHDGKAAPERITLTREKLQQNAVSASTFVSASGKRVGLLKVPSFSTETVNQVVEGIRTIQNSEAQVIAIDLRGNVGGYMPAGVDMAKLFLPRRAHIIAEVDKSGGFKAYDADGIGAETSLPVYLLVDQRTASAAEIFAAALQDNRRAVVVGTSKTFGKGRIQNIQPLENGAGVAVTRARYVTPTGRDLHGIGIQPNKEPTRCDSIDSANICLSDIL